MTVHINATFIFLYPLMQDSLFFSNEWTHIYNEHIYITSYITIASIHDSKHRRTLHLPQSVLLWDLFFVNQHIYTISYITISSTHDSNPRRTLHLPRSVLLWDLFLVNQHIYIISYATISSIHDSNPRRTLRLPRSVLLWEFFFHCVTCRYYIYISIANYDSTHRLSTFVITYLPL